MYVEHLFEGRTLDAETIELKEEIYGNLTARFDDYVAQGMSEEEAYRRTCEAVSSVEDVLDEGDEALEPTTAMPAAASEPEPAPTVETPPEPAAGPAPTASRRWSTAAIVAVVAVVLVVVGIAGCTVFNMLDTRKAAEDYQSQTSQVVEQTGRGDDATAEKDGATTGGSSATRRCSSAPCWRTCSGPHSTAAG